MTIATWPVALPQCPNLQAWNEQPQPNIGAFTPSVGTPIMTRRSTAKTWSHSLTYRMSNAQVLTFKTFYETTLLGGSLPFSWAHPVTKEIFSWCFDKGDEPQITRFAPAAQTVTFRLLRLP